VLNVLKQETFVAPYQIRGFDLVGPKVGAELRSQALNATLLALAGMLIYIAFRFELIYGLAAVIAVFHDTIITIGLFSIFDKEISLTVIAALLTLVGFSMNDTIVVFDRIRENLPAMRREKFDNVVNLSINQTLSRTILTSGLTFITAAALWVFGGAVLNGFSFALVVGIIIGTYSSIFIASPILIWGREWMESRRNGTPAAGASPAAAVKVKSLK
jgi:preprotein translocase subunit SecF